jgi:tetratricopeptide (TPR) repeat protein
MARVELKDYRGAIADFTVALERQAGGVRPWFLRAHARRLVGDYAEAVKDLAEGLSRRPDDELSWVARAEALIQHGKAADALDALAYALAINPRSLPALQSKAHVLSEHLGRPREAIATLDDLLTVYPDYAAALVGRGVLLARQGDRTRAHRDAGAALAHDTQGVTLYQAACIYALTARLQPDDRFDALRLLEAALRRGFGRDLLQTDDDLANLRDTPEFRRLLAAASNAVR